jgi:hypothetical protein
MPQPDYLYLIPGIGVLLASAYLVSQASKVAEDIHHYYHSIPNPKRGPAWFRWQFRPSRAQAWVLSTALMLLGFSIGTGFVIAAWR